jgi:hypothetical protein
VRHGVAGVVEAQPLRVGERRRLAVRRRRQGLPLRGGERVRGHDEAADAGAHPVEDVAPAPGAPAAVAALVLVHLEVAREPRLPGQEPADDAPPPPLPQGAASRGEGGRRPGAPERPLGRRGGDGLDLAREGGQPLPQAREVAVLPAAAAAEGWQLVLERPGRQEPRLLDGLQDCGHGWAGRVEASRQGKQRGRAEKLALEPAFKGQWSSPPALSPPTPTQIARSLFASPFNLVWSSGQRMVERWYVYVSQPQQLASAWTDWLYSPGVQLKSSYYLCEHKNMLYSSRRRERTTSPFFSISCKSGRQLRYTDRSRVGNQK